MQLPLIHLNGTSRESLLDDACTACDAVRAAITALKDTAPNDRDYYPLVPDALRRAQDEYNSRAERLGSVLRELEELAMGIANAGK